MEWLSDLLGVGATVASGGLFGALVRLIPEGIKLLQARGDHAHELAMRELDWKIAKEQGEQKIREVDAQGGWEMQGKQLDALREALAGQSKMTGVPFIDGLNQSVRPVITYYFAALYGLVKLSTFLIAAFSGDIGAKNALAVLWTAADSQMFFGILGFWFVDRQLGKGAVAR